MSRSPSVLMAYLMIRREMSLAEAIDTLKRGKSTGSLALERSRDKTPTMGEKRKGKEEEEGEGGKKEEMRESQKEKENREEGRRCEKEEGGEEEESSIYSAKPASSHYTPLPNEGFKRQLMFLECRLIHSRSREMIISSADRLPSCCDCWDDAENWEAIVSPLSACPLDCGCDCHSLKSCSMNFFEKETRSARTRSKRRAEQQKRHEEIIDMELRRSNRKSKSKSNESRQKPRKSASTPLRSSHKISKDEEIGKTSDLSPITELLCESDPCVQKDVMEIKGYDKSDFPCHSQIQDSSVALTEAAPPSNSLTSLSSDSLPTPSHDSLALPCQLTSQVSMSQNGAPECKTPSERDEASIIPTTTSVDVPFASPDSLPFSSSSSSSTFSSSPSSSSSSTSSSFSSSSSSYSENDSASASSSSSSTVSRKRKRMKSFQKNTLHNYFILQE